MAETVFCGSCGQSIDGAALYCRSCGARQTVLDDVVEHSPDPKSSTTVAHPFNSSVIWVVASLITGSVLIEIASGFFSYYGGKDAPVWSSTSNVWFNVPQMVAIVVGLILFAGFRHRVMLLLGSGIVIAATLATTDVQADNIHDAIAANTVGPGFILDKLSFALALAAVVVLMVALARRGWLSFGIVGAADVTFISVGPVLAILFGLSYLAPQQRVSVTRPDGGVASALAGPFTQYRLFSGVEPRVIAIVTGLVAILIVLFAALMRQRLLGVGFLAGWVAYMVGVAGSFLYSVGHPGGFSLGAGETVSESVAYGGVMWIVAVVAIAVLAIVMVALPDRRSWRPADDI